LIEQAVIFCGGLGTRLLPLAKLSPKPMVHVNKKPLYINTFADIPSNSGLGLSSAFTVGLIAALSKLDNQKLSKIKIVFDQMVLVWTGKNRSASDVLNNVKNNIKKIFIT
tara:strand:+ start:286 stop:615 length:330 start_codon:yes stop_codon:yes gene_type:complete